MTSIPYDKALHAIAGCLISLVPLLGPLWGVTPGWLCPLAFAAFAGAVKEGYDNLHRDRHTVDFYDFLATTAGGLPVTITLALLA